MRFCCLLIILGVGRCISPGSVLFAADEPTGSIKGTILFKGEIPKLNMLVKPGANPACGPMGVINESLVVDPKTMGLRHVFIYMDKKPEGYVLPAPKPGNQNVDLDQINCRFEPHTLIVHTNQTLLAKSQDAFVHNLRTNPIRNSAVNILIQPLNRVGVPIALKQPERLPMPVQCDIHAWMRSTVLVVDHPFAALTDETGNFEIKDVPIGQHQFTIWHEGVGYIYRKVPIDVQADEVTTVKPIHVPADKFK